MATEKPPLNVARYIKREGEMALGDSQKTQHQQELKDGERRERKEFLKESSMMKILPEHFLSTPEGIIKVLVRLKQRWPCVSEVCPQYRNLITKPT